MNEQLAKSNHQEGKIPLSSPTIAGIIYISFRNDNWFSLSAILIIIKSKPFIQSNHKE